MVEVAVDGSGRVERLYTTDFENELVPDSWSPDGRTVAFTELHPETNADIRLLQMEGARSTRSYLSTRFLERDARFSPDGRWVAYESDETGRFEIYVRGYPDAGRKWQLSTGGGVQAIWSPLGDELFYRSVEGDMMFSVEMGHAADGELRPKRPESLFEGRFTGATAGRSYDVHPDGTRFLMMRDVELKPAPIEITLNWTEELKRLVRADN